MIQREHIKNKRLDDLITTAGNYQQQNLQTSLERVNQKLGAETQLSESSVSPSVDYGSMPRQLGVTPYPTPPPTINFKDELSRFDGPSNDPPVPKPSQKPPTQDSSSSFQGTGEGKSEPIETKKAGFPWLKSLAGTALAASVATNGFLLYKSMSPSPTVVNPPANNTDIYVDPSMGSVSIGVE